jgi:hypothetical protein
VGVVEVGQGYIQVDSVLVGVGMDNDPPCRQFFHHEFHVADHVRRGWGINVKKSR